MLVSSAAVAVVKKDSGIDLDPGWTPTQGDGQARFKAPHLRPPLAKAATLRPRLWLCENRAPRVQTRRKDDENMILTVTQRNLSPTPCQWQADAA